MIERLTFRFCQRYEFIDTPLLRWNSEQKRSPLLVHQEKRVFILLVRLVRTTEGSFSYSERASLSSTSLVMLIIPETLQLFNSLIDLSLMPGSDFSISMCSK